MSPPPLRSSSHPGGGGLPQYSDTSRLPHASRTVCVGTGPVSRLCCRSATMASAAMEGAWEGSRAGPSTPCHHPGGRGPVRVLWLRFRTPRRRVWAVGAAGSTAQAAGSGPRSALDERSSTRSVGGASCAQSVWG